MQNAPPQPLQKTLMVGIPTCYGAESLVETVRTLRASKSVGAFPIVIVADRTPISQERKRKLQDMGVTLYWNEEEGSQFKKIRQIRDIAQKHKIDILVLTQDDITFPEQTIGALLQAFQENPSISMVGARVLPLEPKTFFESIMACSVRTIDRVGQAWNNRQNYLMASGRCLAFRMDHFQNFRIPEQTINGDMFLYLENKRLRGAFARPNDAIVYLRCPQTLKDQVGPSSRFQYSKQEMTKVFGKEVGQEYNIPWEASLRGLTKEAITHPLKAFCYLGVYLYTRTKKQPISQVANSAWDVDISTKQIS